jgi:arabinan endo-1,5-alpha-L-arabinosidase
MNHETPRLGGAAWRPLFTPAKTGCYVNDHCVVRAHDGRWHVFGITKDTPEIDPHRERWFCHGAGPSLAEGGFEELGRVCDFGARAWAPAVAFDGQRWVMLYGPDRLRAAICDDARLESWHEAPCTLTGGPPFGVMRDGMIFRLDDDTWLLYATGKRGPDGAVSVCVSENLLDWRFVRFALRTTPAAGKQPPWAATESPFVFAHGGAYWLSLTYTTSGRGARDYHDTLLFRSANPFDFGFYTGDPAEPAATLEAHAPEYLVDPDTGRWYVTSAGWPGDRFGTVIPGSVAIRELDWKS